MQRFFVFAHIFNDNIEVSGVTVSTLPKREKDFDLQVVLAKLFSEVDGMFVITGLPTYVDGRFKIKAKLGIGL